MMGVQEVPVDVVGGTSFDRYRKQSIESTYNMIISDGALVPFSGYKNVKSIAPKGTARQLYRSANFKHLISVIDDVIYEIAEDLSTARVGELDTSRGDVYIADNNANQIAFVDGLKVYIYDHKANTFEGVTVDFAPVYITFMDGYFIAADGNSNEWHLSDLNNGKIWRTAQDTVGALETRPDTLVAVIRHPDIPRILVIGKTVTEIWSPFANESPTPVFPFSRDNSLEINYGAVNRGSIASGFGMVVWLATNEAAGPTIHVFSKEGSKSISTDGIDFVLDKLKRPEEANAFLFEEDGHVFYFITFPSDEVSYVYDFNTNKFFNVTDNCLNAHIAKRVAFFSNKHYFVSDQDANLYELGTDITTLDGHECPRLRITKPIRALDSKRFITTNVGLTIEQGNNEEKNHTTTQRVGISLSKDGSDTFGNVDFQTLNALGNRRNKLQWWRLGAANDLTIQFQFYSDARFVVIGGWLRIRQ